MFTTILTAINVIALIATAIGFFLSKYTIVDLETWNEIAHFYNEHKENEEEGEAEGGCGFFWNYIDEVSDDVLDEPDEEEDE